MSNIDDNTLYVKSCPECGYVIEDEAWINLNFDFLCPRCEKASISNFRGKTI